MFQLVYVSTEAQPFSTDDLVRLLEKSRENNARLHVTGMLLYQDGLFMQALEGDEETVRALADRIAADPRHAGVMILHAAESAKRDFPDWSMGFRDSSSQGFDISGYTRFLDSGVSALQFMADPPKAKKLMLDFKQSGASLLRQSPRSSMPPPPAG